MYKICTLLSTGFVDSLPRAAEAAPPEALAGAGFGAADVRHWESVNDVEKARA
jgi:hypothetical protein